MSLDPYTTLGVSKNASPDEIKKAYRKLAHQHHPDKKGGNEARFKEVNEAYQILGDAEKKSRYDQFGHAGTQGGFGGGQAGYQDFNFDFGGRGGGFENIFDMFTGGGFGATRQKPEKGEDLHLNITTSSKDLGKQKVYEFEAFVACEDCSGTGAKDGKLRVCGDCKGQGRVQQAVRTPLGTFAQVVVCPTCDGDGEIPEHQCPHCHGTGRNKTKRKLELHIPSVIPDRYLVVFPQQGNAGLKGTPPGDLMITIKTP
jgi:molecular chaperone DnaJ